MNTDHMVVIMNGQVMAEGSYVAVRQHMFRMAGRLWHDHREFVEWFNIQYELGNLLADLRTGCPILWDGVVPQGNEEQNRVAVAHLRDRETWYWAHSKTASYKPDRTYF